MVKKTSKEDRTLYKCEVCGLHYETESRAGECENWCSNNNSCNLEIIAHAIENKEKEL